MPRQIAGGIVAILHAAVDAYLSNLTTLCCDNNHTIGTTLTIDSRGGGIAGRRRFNVLLRNLIKTTLYAIDEHQSTTVGTEGTDASNPELRLVLAGLTGKLLRDDAGDNSTKRVGKVA